MPIQKGGAALAVDKGRSIMARRKVMSAESGRRKKLKWYLREI